MIIPPDGLTANDAQTTDTLPPLIFTVEGIPVQQGSKTAFVVKGRAVMTDQNKAALKPWREHVTRTSEVAALRFPMLDGALAIVADFYMPRGKTVTRPRPSVVPDVDKLARALLDGITDAGVWKDDALVVDLHVREWYADGRPPGVDIQISAA